MKQKILMFLIAFTMALVAPKADAQVTNMLSQYSLTVDTVTTGSKYLTAPSTISGYKKVVTIQFLAVEISGTTAGTAQVQGSLDGTNYYDIGSAYTLTDVASQVTSFIVSDFGSLYLRLKVTASGTMSDKIYAKFLTRNQ